MITGSERLTAIEVSLLLAGALLAGCQDNRGAERPGGGLRAAAGPSLFQDGVQAGVCAGLRALPPLILWVWERPEDLRFLPSRGVGVSFLAETVTLRGGEVRVRPRLQGFKVTPGTPLVACARVETDPMHPPALSTGQVTVAAAAIARLGSLRGIAAVQVDFDATTSERAFYVSLLNNLRRQLLPSMPLSITALTSWCTGDPWIADLPVDEAVPMLFRMGAEVGNVRLRLEEGRDFIPAVCRDSMGVSTDEPIRDLIPGRRLYVFRPDGWSQEAFQFGSRGGEALKRAILWCAAAAVGGVLVVCWPRLGPACGPFFYPLVFTNIIRPDLPVGPYTRGQLGVVEPRYDRIYLYVAYRNLAGSGFDAAEALSLWANPPNLMEVSVPSTATPPPHRRIGLTSGSMRATRSRTSDSSSMGTAGARRTASTATNADPTTGLFISSTAHLRRSRAPSAPFRAGRKS